MGFELFGGFLTVQNIVSNQKLSENKKQPLIANFHFTFYSLHFTFFI